MGGGCYEESATNRLYCQSFNTLLTMGFLIMMQKSNMAHGKSSARDEQWSLSCYTCVNVSDNDLCNRFAIDRPCPHAGTAFCRTMHIMDSRGRSVLVDKKCAAAAECLEGNVGCLEIEGQRMCVSCCDEPFCNKDVPTDYHNAILNRTAATSGQADPSRAAGDGRQSSSSSDANRNSMAVGDQPASSSGSPSAAMIATANSSTALLLAALLATATLCSRLLLSSSGTQRCDPRCYRLL